MKFNIILNFLKIITNLIDNHHEHKNKMYKSSKMLSKYTIHFLKILIYYYILYHSTIYNHLHISIIYSSYTVCLYTNETYKNDKCILFSILFINYNVNTIYEYTHLRII